MEQNTKNHQRIKSASGNEQNECSKNEYNKNNNKQNIEQDIDTKQDEQQQIDMQNKQQFNSQQTEKSEEAIGQQIQNQVLNDSSYLINKNHNQQNKNKFFTKEIHLNNNMTSEYDSQSFQPSSSSSQRTSQYIQGDNWRQQLMENKYNKYDYIINQDNYESQLNLYYQKGKLCGKKNNGFFGYENQSINANNANIKQEIPFNQVKGPEDDWSPTQSMIENTAKMDFGSLVLGIDAVQQVFQEQNKEYQFEFNDSNEEENKHNQKENSSSEWSESSSQSYFDSDELEFEDINSSDMDSDDSIDTQINLQSNRFQTSRRIDQKNLTMKNQQIYSSENSLSVLGKLDEQKIHYIRSKLGKQRGNAGQEKEFKYEFIEGNVHHKYKQYLNSKQNIYDIGIGACSRKGSNSELPNQDDYFIYNDNVSGCSIFGIFDGHGPYGHKISSLVSKLIFNNIIKSQNWTIDPSQCLQNLFQKINPMIEKKCKTLKRNKFSTLLSGCACTVIIKKQNKLYIASIGDTQAILFRNNWVFNQKKVNKNSQFVQLTQKHLPTEETEKLRIYHSQGEVKILKNDYVPKIFVRGRDYPALHISRSIGDKIAHKIGVTCQPEIQQYEINKQLDYFMVMCTQSVSEFLDPEEIYHVLSTQTEDKVRDNTDMLQKRVKQAWTQNENFIEDYSFIVIYFQ